MKKVFVVFLCLFGSIFFSCSNGGGEIAQQSLSMAEDLVDEQIYNETNEGGYKGLIEVDKYYGFKSSTTNLGEGKKVVTVKYKLAHNEYSEKIFYKNYFILFCYDKNELIGVRMGEDSPSKDLIKQTFQEFLSNR